MTMSRPLTARSFVGAWLALLCLTALTFGLSHVPLGAAATPVALVIAVGKASLIALVFMGLVRADFAARFTLVGAGMLLVLLLLVVVLDATTRAPGARPVQSSNDTAAKAATSARGAATSE